MKKLLSASVMCADLNNMQKSVEELEKSGIDLLHIDIMDGSFVPNITFGFDHVNAIKSISNIPLDVHMMVSAPALFIDRMNLDENDIISVHCEADVHIHKTLEQIKNRGVKSALALNPHTPVENIRYITDYIDMLLIMTVSPGFAGQKLFAGAEKKTRDAREYLDSLGCDSIPIEVDGNISPENAKKLSACGADIFVLGTSGLFVKNKSVEQAAADLRNML